MLRIFATGVSGLLGSAFASLLLRQRDDVEIIALVRSGGGLTAKLKLKENIVEQLAFDGYPELNEQILKRIKLIDGDLFSETLEKDLKKFGKIDSIFHCAADVNLGHDFQGETYNINYIGTENLLKIAEKLEISSFHFVSTAYVSGKTEGLIKEDELPAEEFNNSYEISKYKAEKLVRNSKIPFTIYRPSIVVGRYSDGRIRKPMAFYNILDFTVKLKMRACRALDVKASEWLETPLRLESGSSQNIYFVPVDYVQKATVDIFNLPNENKTYHLTGSSPVSVNDIRQAISESLKVNKIELVDNLENPTPEERLFHRFLAEFLPYFNTESLYDLKNITEAFGSESLNWNIDKTHLVKMFKGYIKEKYPQIL